MFHTLARPAAIGLFALGALLGAPATAFAQTHGPADDGDYMDDDLPPSVAVFQQPRDLTYCPPGYHVADDAIQIPGVPKGCEPSIPLIAVPPAVLGDGHEVEMEIRAGN